MADGDGLTFSIELRSNDIEQVSARLMHQEEPWGTVAGPASLPLGPEWQRHEVTWSAANPSGTPVRLSLDNGNHVGTIEVRDASLMREPAALVLEDRRWRKARSRCSPTAAAQPPEATGASFLVDCELDYTRRMSSLLREELGVEAAVLDSQVNYGGHDRACSARAASAT